MWMNTLKLQGPIDRIARTMAGSMYPRNRDRSLEYGDFVQEIVIELIQEVRTGDVPIGAMWRIARNTAIDLLGRGTRRAHPSLNDPISGEGDTEWGDLFESLRSRQEIDDLLFRVAVEEVLPLRLRSLLDKRNEGYTLTTAERQRLCRLKNEFSVTIWDHLLDKECKTAQRPEPGTRVQAVKTGDSE